jgi:glutaredoxin
MGRWYWVHVLSDCEFCANALRLLNQTGFQYVVSFYDRNLPILEGTKNHWNHQTVPIIIEYRLSGDPVLIGGYDDLVEYFKDEGYMPEEKKE